MKRRHARQPRGMTLVEVLFALMIVTFATTAVLAWTATLQRMGYYEALSASAIQLCQYRIEEIKAMRFDQLDMEKYPERFEPEIDIVMDSRGTEDPSDDILATRVVVIEDVGDSDVPLKQITVRSTYKVGREEFTEELITWISIAG